jgi:hypothetical protein
MNNIEKLKIAITVYDEICKGIEDLKFLEKKNIKCSLPSCIEVDGVVFLKEEISKYRCLVTNIE